MGSRYRGTHSSGDKDGVHQADDDDYPRKSDYSRRNTDRQHADRRSPRRGNHEGDGDRYRQGNEDEWRNSVDRTTRRRSRSRSTGRNPSNQRRSRSPVNHRQDSSRSRRFENQRQSPSRSHSPHAHDEEAQRRPPRSRSPSNVRPPLAQEYHTENRSISTSKDKLNGQQLGMRSKSESPENMRETKDEPNFEPSGKLAAETKTFQGVVLKYHEPPEARKPIKKWRLYVFKLEKEVDLFHIHHQSAYLFGRDRLVVDVPIDHPSSSKQHAVIQFRQVSSTNEFGESKTNVKPFIIDLESANGTFVNKEKIPVSRYYELQSGDVIKFGFSTREFVLIPET